MDMTETQRTAILRLVGDMPYGGAMRYQLTDPTSPQQLVLYLEELRDRLVGAVDDGTQRQQELQRYRDAVQGFGALLRLAGFGA